MLLIRDKIKGPEKNPSDDSIGNAAMSVGETAMSNSGSSESNALVRQAQGGDTEARSQLLELYRGRLRRMIAIRLDKRLAARVDPSDIVQEALRDAFNRLGEYFANPQISFYP